MTSGPICPCCQGGKSCCKLKNILSGFSILDNVPEVAQFKGNVAIEGTNWGEGKEGNEYFFYKKIILYRS